MLSTNMIIVSLSLIDALNHFLYKHHDDFVEDMYKHFNIGCPNSVSLVFDIKLVKYAGITTKIYYTFGNTYNVLYNIWWPRCVKCHRIVFFFFFILLSFDNAMDTIHKNNSNKIKDFFFTL